MRIAGTNRYNNRSSATNTIPEHPGFETATDTISYSDLLKVRRVRKSWLAVRHIVVVAGTYTQSFEC